MHIGYAVWQLQTLEDALAAHHVMLHDVAPRCRRDAFEAAIEKRRAQTLGTLLKLSGFATTLSSDLRDRLNALLSERNWLLHRSRREVHVELNTDAGASRLLARLAVIAKEATVLSIAVQEATERHLVVKGISAQKIARDAHAILREWETGRRHSGEIGLT